MPLRKRPNDTPSPTEHFLPSFPSRGEESDVRITPEARNENIGQTSARPLRRLPRSRVPESRQKAASYANKGEDKSAAPTEESGDGIMITN